VIKGQRMLDMPLIGLKAIVEHCSDARGDRDLRFPGSDGVLIPLLHSRRSARTDRFYNDRSYRRCEPCRMTGMGAKLSATAARSFGSYPQL
jgi:hypothetical protein